MLMYDYVCQCMTIYGYVWLCMTMYDYIRLCMTVYDYIWLCITIYDDVWLCMTMYGSIWIWLYHYFNFLECFKLCLSLINSCSYAQILCLFCSGVKHLLEGSSKLQFYLTGGDPAKKYVFVWNAHTNNSLNSTQTELLVFVISISTITVIDINNFRFRPYKICNNEKCIVAFNNCQSNGRKWFMIYNNIQLNTRHYPVSIYAKLNLD